MPHEKILVVEDDQNIRQILKFRLERAGYDVSTAENGEEGLEKVKEVSPDLVLLDLMMPVMDGREACRRLKSHFNTSHIPVIMLTAKSDIHDKVGGLRDGANDYLTKPYDPKELLLRVQNILQWSRSQRDASPLTGLPGNISIEQEANRRIVAGTPFAFLYADIDNFKVVNDYYGYSRGDDAIRATAGLLAETVQELGTDGDFIGHVGGDDFVIITTPEHADAIGEHLKTEFDRRVPGFYNKVDLDRGYIEVLDRQGTLRRFPVMSLTVAIITTEVGPITHYAKLIDAVADLKRYGKSQTGSVVVKERRSE
jgi:PleD family two-component response regulator